MCWTWAIIFVLIIFVVWIFFIKKNNSAVDYYRPPKGLDLDLDLNLSVILNENAEVYKQNPSIYQIKGLEFIDTSSIFDGCGKDITYSNKLLRQLYGPLIDDKILMYNKDDELLYNNRWTSVNVCKNLNQKDIDIYGLGEATLK